MYFLILCYYLVYSHRILFVWSKTFDEHIRPQPALSRRTRARGAETKRTETRSRAPDWRGPWTSLRTSRRKTTTKAARRRPRWTWADRWRRPQVREPEVTAAAACGRRPPPWPHRCVCASSVSLYELRQGQRARRRDGGQKRFESGPSCQDEIKNTHNASLKHNRFFQMLRGEFPLWGGEKVPERFNPHKTLNTVQTQIKQTDKTEIKVLSVDSTEIFTHKASWDFKV